MGKRSKMCSYVGPWLYSVSSDEQIRADEEMQARGELHYDPPAHPTVIHKRIRCPECKRRMIADTSFGHDGILRFRVPPHKRKGWWKRKRKSRRRK